MKERFNIQEFHICTFNFEKTGIKPNLEEYPRRLCVVDYARKRVIDIKHKLEYDYIETMSGLYLINSSIDKIKQNKRAAIFPIVTYLSNIEDKDLLNQAKEMIKYLETGQFYQDGNEVLNNEQYLEKIKQDVKKEEKSKVKTKKIGKKGK